MSGAITSMGATAIRDAVSGRRVSVLEIARAHLERIERLDPAVNAVCTLNPRLERDAQALDARLDRGEPARALEGVPFVVKDNLETADLRTTYGAVAFSEHVPASDCVAVARLRAAGALLVGKTNTPELAADINTTNALFGQTRNPWDLNATAGGSSGGTGAALAAGFAALGLGTDLGGSVRIPASFNGLCGLRPSPGRIPVFPQAFAFETLVPHVHGPMARNVTDLALAMSVLAGPDARDPLSLHDRADYVASTGAPAALAGVRFAYVGDLAGLVPVDEEVSDLVRAAAHRFEHLGASVQSSALDASELPTIIAGTRAFNVRARFADYAASNADTVSASIANQVRGAEAVDIIQVVEAERLRSQYWHRVQSLLAEHDFLLLPSVGVEAFRLDEPLPDRINGRSLANFYDVILSTYAFSVLGLPALSVPAGFTAGGLPVGLQIVGQRPHEDRVLGAAAAYATCCGDLFDRIAAVDVERVRPVHPGFATGGVPVTR